MIKKSKNTPLVSIVINIFNGERYIEEALKTVFKQTYKNWEVIFWDNKSTDSSKKKFKKFKDKRLKYYLAKKHCHLYGARNLAIKKCKGSFITFLDADDLWLPSRLEEQIKFMKLNKQYKIIYTNYYVLKNDKKYLFKSYLPEGYITQRLLDRYDLGISTVMLKRELFVKNFFSQKLNIIGDFDFFINLSLKEEIGCIQKPLSIYRKHSSNFSIKNSQLHINEISEWILHNKKNNKKFKNYSLKGQILYLQSLKIKEYFRQNKKHLILGEILKAPINFKKIKYIIYIFLPRVIVNKYLI